MKVKELIEALGFLNLPEAEIVIKYDGHLTIPFWVDTINDIYYPNIENNNIVCIAEVG